MTADPANAVPPPRPPEPAPQGDPGRATSSGCWRRRASATRRSSLRDRALFEVLYGAGARISEAVGLDVDDIDLGGVDEPASVRLLGKGDKQRVVPLGPVCGGGPRRVPRPRAPASSPPTGRGTPALFLNQRGARLSRQSAWGALQQAAAAGRPGRPRLAAYAPALVRHAPARRRGRRAGRAGAARARLGDDDPDLHAGQSATPARGLCRGPPEGALIGSHKRFQHEC